MENMELDFKRLFNGIFLGKTVLITGHTGFKGSWLALWLHLMGAKVVGYALDPITQHDNFTLCNLENKIIDIRGDIRDKERVNQIFKLYKPEMIFHLAAQPIVTTSYQFPKDTIETNVIGTVNVLECIKEYSFVKSSIIVTSDKCYENKEQIWGYKETDSLGGFDPYSASKGCAEIITSSYQKSFNKNICSVRAGNVIGGGDWSINRIIPDCVKSLKNNKDISIRYPNAIRPWQFVLEPLYGYLLLMEKMTIEPIKYCGAWNFGPNFNSIMTVKDIVNHIINIWGYGKWIDMSDKKHVHEASLLNLDCTKAKIFLGFSQKLSIHKSLEKTLEWYKNYENENMYEFSKNQIEFYIKSNYEII